MVLYQQRVHDRLKELERELARFVAAARLFRDVHAVYVFGSFARGSVGPRSDLDLLVVRDTTRSGPMRAEDLAIAARLTIESDILVLTPEEYERRSASTKFWRDVLADARQVYAA